MIQLHYKAGTDLYIDRDVSSSDITEDLITVLPSLCTVYYSSGPVNWYNLTIMLLIIL